MIDFEKSEDIVRFVLERYPMARNDDWLLYLLVLDMNGYGGYRIDELINNRKLSIPKYSTIERCRRKLQAKDETLKPCEMVLEQRQSFKEEYKDYSRRK